MSTIKLSVCIATYKRAAFIGETLASIASQMTDEVEIVIVDGASPDNTEEIVSRYKRDTLRLVYHRREINRGFDEDLEHAVSLASGEYCWLMSDDDILKPGAIQAVLDAMTKNYGLVLVNAEIRNKGLDVVLEKRFFATQNDRIYTPSEFEQFFVDHARYLTFVGCVVIRKNLWMQRDRKSYFGTVFVHIGVILQERIEDDILVLATPFIGIRYGNAQWSDRSFEIWMFKWPKLIWSFSGISAPAKAKVYPREPWKQSKKLLLLRGMGAYSSNEYDKFIRPLSGPRSLKFVARLIAGLPGRWVNRLGQFYYGRLRRSETYLIDLRASKFGAQSRLRGAPNS